MILIIKIYIYPKIQFIDKILYICYSKTEIYFVYQENVFTFIKLERLGR